MSTMFCRDDTAQFVLDPMNFIARPLGCDTCPRCEVPDSIRALAPSRDRAHRSLKGHDAHGHALGSRRRGRLRVGDRLRHRHHAGRGHLRGRRQRARRQPLAGADVRGGDGAHPGDSAPVTRPAATTGLAVRSGRAALLRRDLRPPVLDQVHTGRTRHAHHVHLPADDRGRGLAVRHRVLHRGPAPRDPRRLRGPCPGPARPGRRDRLARRHLGRLHGRHLLGPPHRQRTHDAKRRPEDPHALPHGHRGGDRGGRLAHPGEPSSGHVPTRAGHFSGRRPGST